MRLFSRIRSLGTKTQIERRNKSEAFPRSKTHKDLKESDLGDSKVLCARPDLMCESTLKVLFARKGYAWQQPGGEIRGKECRLLPHPKPTEMLEQNCVSDTAECGRRRRGLMNACAAVVVSAPYC